MAAELTKDATADDVVAHLRSIATEKDRDAKARYGINTARCLGVPHGKQRAIAKAIGRNHDRALSLWQTQITEAQLVGAFTADPKQFTAADARRWAADFDSWDIVDGCGDLFAQCADWRSLTDEFIADEREFVRRMAFVIMTYASIKRKKLPDDDFLPFLAMIEDNAGDERNFVKKGVSWALRSIGKRSPLLREKALEVAQRLATSESKPAAWIGRDTIRDLNTASTLRRMAKVEGKKA